MASTSDSMRPYGPSSRPSSELLHGRISSEDYYIGRARSEATTSHLPRPRSQAPDHLHTGRSAANDHELVRSALNTDTFDEEDRQQRQEEQEEEEEKGDDDDDEDNSQPQQEVNNAAAALTSKKFGDAHLSSKEGESPRPAKRQRPLL